jgi:hypothetical protein
LLSHNKGNADLVIQFKKYLEMIAQQADKCESINVIDDKKIQSDEN